MSTMYEMIMDLPLFKGISKDQVSALLECTSIVFKSYRPGENVAQTGDACRHLIFIIKGTVQCSCTCADASVTMSYVVKSGAVIGADSLFGLATTYVADYVCLSPTSVLVLSKDEYMKLLAREDIYRMNYLNYLSRGLQQSRSAAINFNNGSLMAELGRWVTALTDQYSHHISLRFHRTLTASERKQAEIPVQAGIINLSEQTVMIPDRLLFAEYLVREK